MPLCFIEPQEAIRVVAESVGREARRPRLGEVVRGWGDEIPDDELDQHYAKAVDDLDDDDLSMLAAWHASLEVGHPIANKEFLLRPFTPLGEHPHDHGVMQRGADRVRQAATQREARKHLLLEEEAQEARHDERRPKRSKEGEH